MTKLLITYTKSTIGYNEDQKRTVRSLGLRKLRQAVVQPDNAAIRGMVFRVRHLVKMEEVADDYSIPVIAAPARPRIVPAGEQSAAPATTRIAAPVLAEPVAEVAVEAEPVAEVAVEVAGDDLEIIEGIGPKIAGVLRDAGITTFAQLATTSSEALEEILRAADLSLFNVSTWAQQAQLAADGKIEELRALQDRIKGGRIIE